MLRVGSISTLSRNFQSKYLEPLIDRDQILVVVRSGDQEKLLTDLENHDCDVVLTNVAPARDSGREWLMNALDEQPVSLIGNPKRIGDKRDVETLLSTQPLIVPTMENSIRIGFDALCDRMDIRPTLRAEVDDMALIRVLAKADMGLAVIPPIVVRDELASGQLEELAQLTSLTEIFYAITVRRRFPNPLLALLTENIESTRVIDDD